MKTKNKIYISLLLVLLVSAGIASAGAADVLEPWEEDFLEEYGDYWLYEEYGRYWFEYFLYEGNNETRYHELLQMYQDLEAKAAAGLLDSEPTPDDNVLEPWEEAFLEQYGDRWLYEEYGRYWFEYFLYEGNNEARYHELLQMYQELEAKAAAGLLDSEPTVDDNVLEPWEEAFLEQYGDRWLYEEYGRYWFEYFLYEGNNEARYHELLQMYQELARQNSASPDVPDVSETPIPVQNITNTTIPTPTVPPVQNVTNTTVPTPTVSPTQNVTVLPEQQPENGFPVIPVVIAGVVVLLLVIGAVVLVKRKGVSKEIDVLQPSKTSSVEEEEEPVAEVQHVEKPEVVETPTPEPKTESVPATPKEWYSAVSSSIAEKYGVSHVSSLTPRQLLEFEDTTDELKEFVRLYEQIRYSPDVGDENAAKLAELAAVIIKQYSA